MATPIRLKRSAVPGKRPIVNDLQLGELALNFYDGYLWAKRDTGGVGIGTTITLLTPWTENFGGQSIYYQNRVGLGITSPDSKLHVDGDVLITGITSTYSLDVDGIQVISPARELQNIASLDSVTTATIEAAIANAPNTFADLLVTGITTLGVTSATNLTTQQLNVTGVGTFLSSGLKVRNPANTFQYNITGGAITADRTLNLPVITGTDTLATLGLSQTFTASQTFNSGITISNGIFSHGGVGAVTIANNVTTNTVAIGGASQTGTMTLGQSTVSQITNIQAGVSAAGTTKTINFGTGGLSGSFTQINIGPSAGVGTVVINSGTNLGIGSTTPTVPLDVVGNGKFTGILTATTFSGQINSGVGTITTLNSTSATIANINSSGIATLGIITASQLYVSGIATVNSNFVVNGNTLYVDAINNRVGVLTATPIHPFQVGAAGNSIVVIDTMGDLGIGTTLPTQKLDVVGNGKFTGIVTATTFSGNLANTLTLNTSGTGLSGSTTFNNSGNSTFTVTSNATSANTGGTIVSRDAAGGFNAGIVTATTFSGNLANTLTLNTSGTGLSGSTTFNNSGAATFTVTSNATSTNTNSTIVSRDAAGGFNAGIITATQFTTGSGNLGFTTNTISGPSIIFIDPSPVGVATTSGIVRILGDLYVDGTQFIVNSTTIELADNNIGIASTVATLALLDGAGIGIGSIGIRKTITWNNTAGALTSSDDWNLASGKQYEIGGTSVLNSTTLGSGVVNSSLTSVGTLTNLNVGNINSTGILTAISGNFSGIITSSSANISGILTSGTHNVTSGNTYQINGTTVLSNNTLGSGVVNSSLTSVGTLNSLNVSTSGVTTVGFITAQNLYVAGVGTFLSSGLKIRNPANTFEYTIAGDAIGANYTVTLPVVTANTGIALTGTANTFTQLQTYNNGITVASGTFNHSTSIGNFTAQSYTTGTFIVGGPSQTGTMTLGQSTVSQTTNIQAGASGVGTTKTINFGTGGLSGSFTQINIGPSAGVGTVVINSGTNLGIGTTTPTVPLDVVGNVKITGVTTTGSLSIGATQVISSARQLQNIASLDSTTTATIEAAIQNAPNTFTDLNVTGIATISVNSSSDALRITQTGTGNALLVEDSANPDSTPFVIDQSGNTGIGTTIPSAILDVRGNPWFSPNITGAKATALRLGRFIDGVNAAYDIITDDATGDDLEIQSNRFAGNVRISRGSPSGIQTTFIISSHYLNGSSISIADTTGTSTKIKIDEAGNSYFANSGNIELRPSGVVLVGTATSTGTSNQKLQVTGGGYFSSSVGIGTTNPQVTLDVVGNARFTGIVTATTYDTTSTRNGSEIATTTTTSQTAIHTGLAAASFRSVEYLVQAVEGTNFHTTKILVVHDGTTAYLTEYGTVYNNITVASYDVDIFGGNLRLLATPASSSSTTFKISFTSIVV